MTPGRGSLTPADHAAIADALVAMSENPGLIPADVDVAEAQRDMAQLDALRPHIARLTKLLGRAEDSEMALGSDAMVTALEGVHLCSFAQASSS